MDTKREKEIGLGADWPFDPMEKNECIINKEIAKNYDIEVGERISVQIPNGFTMQVVIFHYN